MTILSPVQPAARRREAPAVKQLIPAIAADGSFYPIEKMDAHRRAVQHLAVSVFVFSDDELLLQRRAESKYHCGGLWANTCCTHPYWNEADDVSAERRLMEEMGLNLSLTPGAIIEYSAPVSEGLWENERVRIFQARVDRRKVTPVLNPDEVSHARWSSLASIRADIARDPAAYAPWFRIYMSRWSELGL
jgi:isopentenyl-diphosphate delta-isomerase